MSDEYTGKYPYIEKCGFIMGPLYYAFIKWAEEKAKYPVQISMRGGHVISHAAEFCAKQKLAETANWHEMWINRDIAQHLRETKVQEYIKKSNLDKPFTLVDNGYHGKVSEAFIKKGNEDLQTLFVMSYNDPKWINYFLNDDLSVNTACTKHPQVKPSAFANEYVAEELYTTNLYDSFEFLLESIPTQYREYNIVNFVDGDVGIIDSSKTDIINAFYSGVDGGIKTCADYQKEPNAEQTKKYLCTIMKNRDLIRSVLGIAPDNPSANRQLELEKGQEVIRALYS